MKRLRLLAVACASISALTISNAAYAAQSVKSADGSIIFHTGTPYYDSEAASYAHENKFCAEVDEDTVSAPQVSEKAVSDSQASYDYSTCGLRIIKGICHPSQTLLKYFLQEEIIMSVNFVTNWTNRFANPYHPVDSAKKAAFAQRMQQAMNSKSAAPKDESASSWDAFQALIKQQTPSDGSTPVVAPECYSGCGQVEASYDKWAEQHPKTLPESKGWTEENAAWLHMKYAGKLSPHELMDAVDSMRRMKIISRDEQNAIYGCERIIRPLTDCLKMEMKEVTDETDLYPPKIFDGPLAYCSTLDDILQYFKNRRETEPIFEDWYLERYYAGELIAPPAGEDLQPDDTEILEHFML